MTHYALVNLGMIHNMPINGVILNQILLFLYQILVFYWFILSIFSKYRF